MEMKEEMKEEKKGGRASRGEGGREIVLRPGGEKSGEKKAGGVEASKPRGILLAEIESVERGKRE